MRHFRRILVVLFLLMALRDRGGGKHPHRTPDGSNHDRVQDQLSSLTGQRVTLGSLKVSWSFPR